MGAEKALDTKIKQILKDNPDLNYKVIKGILFGLEDIASGNIKKYKKLGSRSSRE